MKQEVSVIIPVYNGESFICRAVESVLCQSYPASEIIVVNDGSTDSTLEKLLTFKNLIKIITTSNNGVSAARNIGMSSSTKDLIAFLDADDIWYQDKLKLQIEVFRKFPSVGFTCCNYLHITRNQDSKLNFFNGLVNKVKLNYDGPLQTSALSRLLETNIVGTSSNVMFKRKLINELGLFDTSLKQAEDLHMWFRFSFVTDFVLTSEVLVEKHTHSFNLTNNFVETLLYRESVIIELVQNSSYKSYISPYIKKAYYELFKCRLRIFRFLFKENSYLQSFRYLFLSIISKVKSI